jgi:hypothetical protein
MSTIRNRKDAWNKFKEQWLGSNDGTGNKVYRSLLKSEGLDYIISEWRKFVDNQYFFDYISESQHLGWQTSFPLQIQWLISTRKYRGDVTGAPRGNPNWIKAKQERLERERKEDEDS